MLRGGHLRMRPFAFSIPGDKSVTFILEPVEPYFFLSQDARAMLMDALDAAHKDANARAQAREAEQDPADATADASSNEGSGTATGADGSAGGQYAQYSQISVKRQVSRDGQSSYFMNGIRCRRRDITGLFLGTGLGPRSYSIIEQGMISRIIEARPEDLRVYLEEAAGISKYKERRRETENRIKHTRENLDRLEDLVEEVSKQLKHLERQAATAEKYKTWKAEERELKGELLLLRWKALDEEIQHGERKLAEQENRLESAITTQR